MSGYMGLLQQGRNKKNYASVSKYKVNRELFTQYNIPTFMKAFPSLPPAVIKSSVDYGVGAFNNCSQMISLGRTTNIWQKPNFSAQGTFARDLAVQRLEDEDKEFYEAPVVKKYMESPGVFTTGGILLENQWTIVKNIYFMDGSIASGKTFQIRTADDPKFDPTSFKDYIQEKFWEDLYDFNQKRLTVTGCEIVTILCSNGVYVPLGPNAPRVIETKPSNSALGFAESLDIICLSQEKSPEYMLDFLKEKAQDIKNAK